MKIRVAAGEDYAEIYQLVKAAFAGAAHSDGTEQDLVTRLRADPAFIPQLEWVVEVSGQIVGHILFSRVEIGGQATLALAPLSVHPDFQRQGIGSQLILRGHEIAQQLGYSHCVVLGDPNYYAKFGYKSAAQFGILAPFEVPSDYFMVATWGAGAKPVSGLVSYAAAFGI